MRRWQLFAIWIVLVALLFARSLGEWVRLCLSESDASYLVLIPVLAACLLYIERRSIFADLSRDLKLASFFVFLGSVPLLAAHESGTSISSNSRLSLRILALVLFWLAGFAFSFGGKATRAAHFSLMFLFLMIPVPGFLLRGAIYLLQAGSADVTAALFDLFRVPALREGFVFHLPQVNIAVERECSGIRSSMALLILALPMVHFGLRQFWKKTVFLICAMFVMILKNGIRIVTMTLLAVYVDPSFLVGKLHREGGAVFFLLGLLLLLPIYLGLKNGESSASRANETPNDSQQKQRSISRSPEGEHPLEPV